MFAIFKRSLAFRDAKGKKLVIPVSSESVAVPDWVRDTPEFKMASADGAIVETVAAGVSTPTKRQK